MTVNRLWAWVSLKIFVAVAILEALLVLFEAVYFINCHFSRTECWPFFFAMAANLPVSIGVMQFTGEVFGAFRVESFWLRLAIESSAFLVVGTLWWSLLLHIPVLIAKLVNQWRARVEKHLG